MTHEHLHLLKYITLYFFELSEKNSERESFESTLGLTSNVKKIMEVIKSASNPSTSFLLPFVKGFMTQNSLIFYRKRNWIKCFTKPYLMRGQPYKFFVWCCHLYTRVSNVVIYFLKKEIKGWHKYNCKFNIVENKYKMLISIKMRIGIFLCRKAKQTMKLSLAKYE